MEEWKIKRELNRIWVQIVGIFSILSSPVRRTIHDMRKPQRVVMTNGAVALDEDIAIYLIYRPQGLLDSHLRTITHLEDQGFSVLVVVNHPLSPTDKTRVLPHVWKLMERPNIGYDFGGYRDGALYLIEEGIYPDCLVFMNDSVWFPVSKGCDFLQEARTATFDVYGFVISQHKRDKKGTHIQSYFMAFKKGVQKSDCYQKFWSKMLMSNSKFVVVKRLERKILAFFAVHGFRVGARYRKDQIGTIIASLNVDRQVKYLETEDAQLGPERDALISRLRAGQNFSVDEWNVIVDQGAIRGHILNYSPKLNFEVLSVQMVKKMKSKRFQRQRKELVAQGYHRNFYPETAREIEDWDSAR